MRGGFICADTVSIASLIVLAELQKEARSLELKIQIDLI